MRGRATRVLAGVAGTLAVGVSLALERRLLGRFSVHAPPRLAGRLAQHVGLEPSPVLSSTAGRLLRWSWGPALGLAWGKLRGPLLPGGLRRGAWLGAGILTGELLLLPTVGATPPLREWPRSELLLLAAHAFAFGMATESVLGRFASRRSIGATRQAPGLYLRDPPPLNPDSDSPLRG